MPNAKMPPEGWRCEKKGEHLYRPKWVDFQGRAIHQLTLVTAEREPLLGMLVVPNNNPDNAYINLTPLGQMVAEEIERIPTYKGASNIKIFRYVIMPDHIHILLCIHERLPKHLGQYVGWFKRQCTSYRQLLAVNPASNGLLFAPEYHTRTLSGKGQLWHMMRYIDDNPRRLWLKRAKAGDIPHDTRRYRFLALNAMAEEFAR
jgi:REP element-mobilizing transposase RayT